MAIQKTSNANRGKISPPPIHEQISEKGRLSQALVRFLIDLSRNSSSSNDELDAIIEFVNNIQEGAGLEDDGTYSPDTLAHYISLATSLKNADSLLDEAIWNYTRIAISTITANASLLPEAQTVLCNATDGAIDIIMPNPLDCFEDNRSLPFAIHKIDTTANVVNILPFGTELIVGEASQSLELDGEIYNFITDGNNWYLGA